MTNELNNEIPIATQYDVLKVANEGIRKIISEKLGGYKSPLDPIIQSSFEKHQTEISKIVDECLSETIKHKSFKAIIKEEFQHKIAKNLVSKMEGFVEKAVNQLIQTPQMKARVILAIENLIKEGKNER
jgi:hypothetical protein